MSHSDESYPPQESGLPPYYSHPESFGYQYFPTQESYSVVPYPAYLVSDVPITSTSVFDENNASYPHATTSFVPENSETIISSASSQGTPQGTPEALTSPYDPQSHLALPISEQGHPGPSTEIPHDIILHDVRLKCDIRDASLLDKHLLLMSSRPKLYRCMSCNISSELLKGTQAAKAHVYQHLFGTSKPYICTCKAEFASERAAERHRRNQVKKYPCQLCGRHFARKDAMRAHERKAKCGTILPGYPAEMHQ